MAWTPRNIKDRQVEHPNRFTFTPVPGAENTFDVSPSPGAITEEGTSINKAYLQPIEDELRKADRTDALIPSATILSKASSTYEEYGRVVVENLFINGRTIRNLDNDEVTTIPSAPNGGNLMIKIDDDYYIPGWKTGNYVVMQRYRGGVWQTLATGPSYVTSQGNILGISAKPVGATEIWVMYTRDNGTFYYGIYDIGANTWGDIDYIGTSSSNFSYRGTGVTYNDGENIPMYSTNRWGGTYDTYNYYIRQKSNRSSRGLNITSNELSKASFGSGVRNGVAVFFVITPWGDYAASRDSKDMYFTSPPHPGFIGSKVLMPHAGNPDLLSVREPMSEEIQLIFGG